MKVTDYRNAMQEVKVSDSVRDQTLKRISEEPVMKHDLHTEKINHKFRLIPAVAAILVIALALTIIMNVDIGKTPVKEDRAGDDSVSDTMNSFVIKAGAAEINEYEYVEVGELLNNGSLLAMGFNNQDDENITDPVSSLMHYKELTVCGAFQLDGLSCSGSNIDTVTYTIHGGDSYISFGEKTGTSLIVKDGEFAGISGDVSNIDTLLTDESECDVYLRFYDNTGVFQSEKYIYEAPFKDDDGTVIYEKRADEMLILAEMLERNRQDVYMDVIVTFNDGTTSTKRLLFDLTKNEENAYTLCTKLADL